MAEMQILYYPHEILTTPAKEVKEITDEVRKLLDDMAETMYLNKGLGLAGNQVGLLQKLVCVDIPEDPENGIQATGLLQMVNPRIVAASGEVEFQEGCLSFPGLYIDVKRSAKVTLEYIDRDGRLQRLEADGLLAVAFQHEVDHTNGVVYVDRLTPRAKKRALKEYDRLKRKMGIH
jgi:peptide deformylase